MGNQVLYKDQTVYLGYDPRIGVCNYCRRVVPFDCSRTHIHHLEYHDDDPLKDAIEACPTCHHREHKDFHPHIKRNHKLIRISTYNYERLAKLGDISWDFDDALTVVLDHWDKTKDSSKK